MRELYLLAAERATPPLRLHATGVTTGVGRAKPESVKDALTRALEQSRLLHAAIFED